MSKTLFTAWDADDIDAIYDVEFEPVSQCPLCCFPLEASTLDVYHVGQNPVPPSEEVLHHVYAICFCPKCRNLFMCKYTAISQSEQAYLLDCISLDELNPAPKVEVSFSKDIQNISGDFLITYNQSQEAESHKLEKIASLGYQMSLELLLKNYLLLKFPDDAVKIKTESLEESMRRIPDTRFQTLADILQETPQNNRIPLIKNMIQTTIHYIESEAAFEASLCLHV